MTDSQPHFSSNVSCSAHLLPWEDAPAGDRPVWRSSQNPIIPRFPLPGFHSVYNSAVVSWKDGFAGVFRVEHLNNASFLHRGFSQDGVSWEIDPAPIAFQNENSGTLPVKSGYDPRLCKVNDDYLVTWCNTAQGATIGLGRTRDFENFSFVGDCFLPYNRNGVMFPRKINGMYKMLSRPSDNAHTLFGDIHLSESPDLIYWGRHKQVMKAKTNPWENVKIGPGPIPIETPDGWLMIYHAVRGLCNGFSYSMGAALLDLEDPSKVIVRGKNFLMTPETIYETTGVTPNVIFPCSCLMDESDGRLAIYYGAADTCLALCFSTVERILDYIQS
ncbi:glycoside hydrolase family 130 protein [Kiritimatiellaeota bacterium B1221]|nr:glycoside hydrolase family 130 protein [Kiritimatiellaeota bacterium B1221]